MQPNSDGGIRVDARMTRILEKMSNFALKTLEMNEETQVYIPLMGKYNEGDTATFSLLEDNVLPFLDFHGKEKDSKIKLLLAKAGSGKSTFLRHLERFLWEKYNPEENHVVPVLLYLSRIHNVQTGIIPAVMEKLEINATEMELMRENNFQFILLLDGYDEISIRDNLWVSNDLDSPKWNNKVKMIITSRPDILGSEIDYRQQFAPLIDNKLRIDLYSRIIIAPFSDKQIRKYLETFVSVMQPKWKAADEYWKVIESLPHVLSMIRTPFVLRILVEVLPNLPELKDASIQKPYITRRRLYEEFVKQWIERGMERIRSMNKMILFIKEKKDRFSYFLKQSKELARTMWMEGITELQKPSENQILAMSTLASYFLPSKGKPGDKKYNSIVEQLELMRMAIPIIPVTDDRWAFIHKSVMEYLVSEDMVDAINELERTDDRNHHLMNMPLNHFLLTNRSKMKRKEEDVDVSTSEEGNREILYFQADKAREDKKYTEKLWEIILQSKSLPETTNSSSAKPFVAAANAITILNLARVSFSLKDLSGVRISGADLEYGIFDHTDLSGADLTNVNLRHCWLRCANMSGANMKETHFGEWPAINVGSPVNAVCWSPDGMRIVSGSYDKTVRVWDAQSGHQLLELHGHTDTVRNVSFSPDGMRIVSGSLDRTVRVWDAQSGHQLLQLHG
ncbi:MAG: pentapeptide repeat-containing protein, partial [Propionibacteriaceae bacterium]|nr:pentapeptide repeat-containing protein [Propionibacteriaceae bacterium]